MLVGRFSDSSRDDSRCGSRFDRRVDSFAALQNNCGDAGPLASALMPIFGCEI
jgi:hypothetical protein